MSSESLWERFQKYRLGYGDLDFSIDISRMAFPDDFFETMEPRVERAFSAMQEVEAGAIANPDEKRMVGHYWLRAPQLAPTEELRAEIKKCAAAIKEFAVEIHASGRFTEVLVIGIGGSALGPQFVSDALGTERDRMRIHFFDNTDPDGMDRVLKMLGGRLAQTLCVVISKSGGTPETRNGMLEAQAAYEKEGLKFGAHAVAVTGVGSTLDKFAVQHNWLARFPMWDWVGGRTSVMSAVGLLPMSLQALDVDRFLAGAAAMDEKTRVAEVHENAAMLLALMWHFAGGGRGKKDMVILPYKDRLALFSKYLQQLVMESLGKERDLDGKVVHQGVAVYGNKGSTDQHAYVQQLRDGVNNFFVTFIEVHKGRDGESLQVEPGFTGGDFLQGFLRGTRAALYENGRGSITISIPQVDAFQVGALIALYERAVGFYASLVNINAYHQPGVEAGKKAASRVLELQTRVRAALEEADGVERTADEIATALGADPEDVFHALIHLVANTVDIVCTASATPKETKFAAKI